MRIRLEIIVSILLVTGIVAGTLTGCGILQVQMAVEKTPEPTMGMLAVATPSPEEHPGAVPTEQPGKAGEPEVWHTHSDTEIGYALDYPANWYIEAIPGWSVILTSFDPAGAPGRGGLPPSQTKIDLLPDKSWQATTLEKLTAETRTQSEKLLWEEEWELSGGVPAVRMQIIAEPGGEMALLLTVINGRSLRLVGYGDLTPFNHIARTLRPIAVPPTPPAPSPPTTVLTTTHIYTDTTLGFAIDYPASWDADGVRGGFVLLSNPATSGEKQQAINIAALAEPSLEAMLDNVERGSFGPYMISAEPVQLGELEALKITLRQAPEGLSLLWLVITPQSQQQGQGLTIAAYGDPALAEAIVTTWRPVSPPLRHDQPTSSALIYRVQGNSIYRADAAGENPHHILDLPENAGHLCLSDNFLAYTDYDEKTICLADLSTGTVRVLYQTSGYAYPDFDLCWSDDGRVLVYAMAYEGTDGDRRVELGTLDGYEQKVVKTLTARPAGPTPTPPPMPPMPPEPGYANLLLLGYDRSAGSIYAVPAGGSERHSAIWAFDRTTGEKVSSVILDDPDGIAGIESSYLSPEFNRLAINRVTEDGTTTAIVIYGLKAEDKEPPSFTLPAGAQAYNLRWSPDGCWLAFLLRQAIGTNLDVRPSLGIWVLDVEEMKGYEVLPLESPEATLVGWSPVGQSLLVSWLEPLSFARYHELINVSSREVTRLPQGSEADILGWATLTPSNLERARESLTSYFSFLHARRYGEAIHYYGGTYDILRDWNPTVAKDDYATLFKNGCTINGLMCLRTKTTVREEGVSSTEFRFVVEFMNDDGTLFVHDPCCGATGTEMPPQTQFTFIVKNVDNKFLVQDLPVYVP